MRRGLSRYPAAKPKVGMVAPGLDHPHPIERVTVHASKRMRLPKLADFVPFHSLTSDPQDRVRERVAAVSTVDPTF